MISTKGFYIDIISMERIFSTIEENSDRQLWKSRKNYTMEDAIVAIVKTMNTLESETNSCWRNLYPDIAHDFAGFSDRAKQGHERVYAHGKKKKEGGLSRYGSLRNSIAN